MKKVLLSCLFAISMFMNAQITLGGGSTNTGAAPISSYYEYSYVQQIFPKSEINANAAGNITELKFYYDASASLASSDQWEVYLGHTSKTGFLSDDDWIPVSQLTQVFSGTITPVNGIVEITLTTPFTYNNTSNLVLAARESKPGYDNTSEAFYTYDYMNGSTLYFRSDTVLPDQVSPPSGVLANFKSSVTFTGLTPGSGLACPVVTSPGDNETDVDIYPNISWSSVSGATGYKISMGTTPNGTDILNNEDAGSSTTWSIQNPLLYNKDYYVKVTAYNTTQSSLGCTESKFTTKSIPCPDILSPQPFAASQSVTPTISWDSVSGAAGYKISIGTTPGGTDVANNVDTGTNLSYTVSIPLLNGTKYYYKVTAYNSYTASLGCDENNFTTICTPALAFSQNFDGVVADTDDWPVCWVPLDTGGFAFAFITDDLYVSAPNSLAIFGFWGSAVVSMPPVSTLASGQYRLKFKAMPSNGAGDNVEVGYLTTPDNAFSFVPLQTFTTSGAAVDTFVLNSITAPAGVTTLAFRSEGIAIDDVVYELMPSCVEPVNLVFVSSTTTTADLSWTAPPSPPAGGYDIYYSTSSMPPAAGATPNVTGNTGTTATISPLIPSTVYYFWVRSRCSASEFSPWESGGSFATQCNATNVPYTMDFELTSVPNVPICTNVVNAGAGNKWVVENDPGSGFTNNTLVYSYNSLNPANAWFFIQGLNLTGGETYSIEFDYGNNSTSYFENLKVAYGSGANAGAMTNIIADFPGITGGTLTHTIHTFTPATSGVYYIGFNTYSDPDQYLLFVDNINVKVASLGTSETVKDKVMVYPNPFSDVLNVSNIKDVRSMQITDVSGKVVRTFEKPSTQVNLRELSSGMYMVVLQMNDGSRQTIKVIKK